MKKFFLDQHGCAKNQVDAEVIISLLVRAGFEYAAFPDCADLIIINSCGFIESAKKESLDSLFFMRKSFPSKKIIFAGCLAQRYAKNFESELLEADGIFGNADLEKIADVTKKVLSGRRVVEKPERANFFCAKRLVNLSFKNSVYVKITEGCSNHCSFCAIPLIRGELQSRPSSDIVLEIRSLLKKGVFEINLVGQDVAAYGSDWKTALPAQKPKFFEVENRSAKKNAGQNAKHFSKNARLCESQKTHSALYELLKKISNIKGNFWIRLLYIHPDHFPLDILELFKNDRRLLPYFDIPFQAGADKIIFAMNRTKKSKECLALVSKIKKALPNAAIRTTFLTGFPAESEEDFLQTLLFQKKIRADWAGVFCFSREEGTFAAKMKNQIPKKIANERKKILLLNQEKITQENLAFRVKQKNKNLEYEVLIEEIIQSAAKKKGDFEIAADSPPEQKKAFAIGRAWFQAPEVDGNFVVCFCADDKNAKNAIQEGSVIRVRAVAVCGADVEGVFLGEAKR